MAFASFTSSTLMEINLYPYLTWAFYAGLFLLSPVWLKKERHLFTLFLVTLAFETAFLIDVGFFIRPAYVIGVILVLKMTHQKFAFPVKYTILFALFVFLVTVSVFFNLDLLGRAWSGETRATFLRPAIQLGQLLVMMFITAAVFTILKRGDNFKPAIRVLHWLSVAVAFAAVYEIVAIYFHLPYINLNNMLPEYWYPRFGTSGFTVFRARVTFIEPIELNNFQMFGIASSLAYRLLYKKSWFRYWPFLALQLIVLLGTFSRSTFYVMIVLAPLFLLFYPHRTYSAFGFLTARLGRVVAVALLVFIVVYTFTVKPERIRQAGPVQQALYTRVVLHQAKSDKLTVLGRQGAAAELLRLAAGGRLALGVGIGNDANWLGGIGGSHSLYNQIIIFGGIIGLVIFLIFVGSLFWGLFKNYLRRINPLVIRQINFIFFIGLLGMMTQRLSFSGLLNDTYLWAAFAFCIYLGQAKEEDFATA